MCVLLRSEAPVMPTTGELPSATQYFWFSPWGQMRGAWFHLDRKLPFFVRLRLALLA